MKQIILWKGATDEEIKWLEEDIKNKDFVIIGGDRELEVYEIDKNDLYRVVPSKVFIQNLEVDGKK